MNQESTKNCQRDGRRHKRAIVQKPEEKTKKRDVVNSTQCHKVRSSGKY